MLQKENELRRSVSVQQRFARAELSESTDWIEVAVDIQKEVLAEFKIRPTEQALNAYRKAANKHGISLYVKHNRAREGGLTIGKIAPDVPLIRTDASMERTTLLSHQLAGRPLVIVAGSLS